MEKHLEKYTQMIKDILGDEYYEYEETVKKMLTKEYEGGLSC